MEQPLNPPPAQRALSLLSKSTHLCQKSAEVRPHQQEHVAHTRQSLGTLLFAMLSVVCIKIPILISFLSSSRKKGPRITVKALDFNSYYLFKSKGKVSNRQNLAV